MALARLFDVKIDWEGDNLAYDVGMAIGEIENNMTPLLEFIGAEMINDLQKHIQTDVYDAYSPKSYPRRKDHPEFGRPLDSIHNFNTKVENSLNTATLEFDYSPDGTHKGKKKDSLDYNKDVDEDRLGGPVGNEPLKPHPVHGDALIKRIQTGEGYDWNCAPGERPFWDNFVQEENNGKTIRYFNKYIRVHSMTNGKYDYTYRGATYRDLSFGAYDAISYETMSDVDDDDLPF